MGKPALPLLLFLFLSLSSVRAFAGAGDTSNCVPTIDEMDPPVRKLINSVGSVTSHYDVTVGVTDDSWGGKGANQLLPGDNYGYAYGGQIQVRKNFAQGTHLGFSYSSDLYTKPLYNDWNPANPNGAYHAWQNFTSDNKYVLTYDNAGHNRLLYYKFGGGMQTLDSAPSDNPLNAANHQLLWHNLTGNLREVVDVPDGLGSRSGALATGAVGVQKTVEPVRDLALSASTDAGVTASTLSGASYGETEANVDAQFRRGWLGASVGLGVEDKFHSGGTERDTNVHFTLLMGKSLQVGANYRMYGGKLINYVNYNIPDVFTGKLDPTMTLWVRKGL